MSETVKLLAVSVAKVRGSMKVSDVLVTVLAEFFSRMAYDMSAIQMFDSKIELF